MIQIDSTFEKFDIAAYNERKGDDFIKPNGIVVKQYVDRTTMIPQGDIVRIDEFQTPPVPYFYRIHKEFYLSGSIQSKGKIVWGFDEKAKTGKWYYFDSTGNLTKTVDEDAKFGKFGYNELLEFLNQEGVINLRTGQNREALKIEFEETKKMWMVEIYTHNTESKYRNGEKYISSKEGFGYCIDSNTGKVIYKRKQVYDFTMEQTRKYEYLIRNGKRVSVNFDWDLYNKGGYYTVMEK